MPRGQKRRAPAPEEEDPESPSESQQPVRQRQRSSSEPDAIADKDLGDYFENEAGIQGSDVQQLARKVVRFALSSEYSRQPIRRADVVAKIFARDQGRHWKEVFIEAQNMLRDVFGMEMVELPARERVTLQQKRAAQSNKDKPTASIKSWVLCSTLPPKYKHPNIIPPLQIPTTEVEAAYTGLYTFIISCIMLHGGTIPESKLDRYLRRMNADRTTPIDKKDKLIQRLIKEQYIVKIRDNTAGEEVIEYMLGPRGKVEVGVEGVAGLVRTVYGGSVEDLEERLDRSLGVTAEREATRDAVHGDGMTGVLQGGTRTRKAGRRGQHAATTGEDDDEEAEEESDEDG